MKQTQLSETEFYEAMNLLDEENRKVVLAELDEAKQKLEEAVVSHQSVMSFLTITLNNHKNGNNQHSGGYNRPGSMATSLQDTLQRANMDIGTEGDGVQHGTIENPPGSVNDNETNS